MKMGTTDLIRRQYETLHALAELIAHYRTAIQGSRARWEHELAQIEAARQASHQEARQEYEGARDRFITAVLDYKYPLKGVKKNESSEKARQKLRDKLVSVSESGGPLTLAIDDTNLIKTEMRARGALAPITKGEMARNIIRNIIARVVAVFLMFGLYAGYSLFSKDPAIGAVIMICSFLLFLLLIWINKIWLKEETDKYRDNLIHLGQLYRHWLSLADRQAQAQKSETERQYHQALEQARRTFSTLQQQLMSLVAEFSHLADQASPPWQNEAWQTWTPGALTPGAVRLGVFVYPPKSAHREV
jgi:hypothetical protein